MRGTGDQEQVDPPPATRTATVEAALINLAR